jgi:S-formylglutathione hydrolase FrmB
VTGVLDCVDFYSKANGRRFAVWTWTPPTPGPHPLLLLLHGVIDSGGHGWWLRARAHESVAALDTPPVLVMPTDTGVELGSAYADWADGSTRAETFLVDELLPWAAAELPVDARRWVSGLSMGGYGALLLALRHPGLFDSAASMSGFFHPARLSAFVPDASDRIWDGTAGLAAHDVSTLLLDPARRGRTRFAFDCGTEDHLIEYNRAMHATLEAQGIPHGYAEHPGGHEWSYWGARVPEHVAFHLDLPGPLS